jgi:hypothetical protein
VSVTVSHKRNGAASSPCRRTHFGNPVACLHRRASFDSFSGGGVNRLSTPLRASARPATAVRLRFIRNDAWRFADWHHRFRFVSRFARQKTSSSGVAGVQRNRGS